MTNHQLGVKFPGGVFIAQDGANTDDGKMSSQNFKLADWPEIARLFTPPLVIDTGYRVGNSVPLSETDH